MEIVLAGVRRLGACRREGEAAGEREGEAAGEREGAKR